MAKDPVCGMEVDEKKAKYVTEYGGKKYFFCSAGCRERFEKNPEDFLKGEAKKERTVGNSLAKDPVCGMVIPKDTSIRVQHGGRIYHFCSQNCLNTFQQPEKKIREMKKNVIITLIFAAIATALTWTTLKLPFLQSEIWLFIATTPVMVFGGKSFLMGALDAIKNKTANMDLLIMIGTWTAYLYSTFIVFFPAVLPSKDLYFEVAAVIIAFVLLGKYAEEVIKKRSSAAVRKLLDLRPAVAKVIKNGIEKEVRVEDVQTGDIVVVRPGDKIPVDGIIIGGSSAIDEKMITGESIPVTRKKGDKVIGATINKTGLLKIKATNVGEDSALMQIVKMVESAQLSSVKIQRLADRAASYFVPFVIIIAVLTFAAWLFVGSFITALFSFVAVLIIACPCALGIATPAALLGGVGKGAEFGILIRSGEVLERAEKLSAVLLDKTGTLTKGEPDVTDIIPFNTDEKEVLRIAAIAEMGSEHPIGEAIVNKAKQNKIVLTEADSYQTEAGKGIKAKYMRRSILVGNRAFLKENGISTAKAELELQKLEEQGKTAVLVAYGDKFIGIIAVADTLKEFSKQAVSALKEMGVQVAMITGDNERTANAIAKQAGIDRVLAQVLPQDKAEEVKKLQEHGKVAFVGDGINDAPALAQADIGIAIGSGSDIAKETGGIILIRNDLRDVISSIKLSKATMRKIKQNLFWAFAYNSVAIPLAALGMLTPIIAAAAMALSSLSVVTNSALLRRTKL